MAAMALRALSLEIISDSICPFCYLGYKQITLAMAAAKKESLPLDFKLRFKPFLLDPTLPTDEPINKRERYTSKFGASRVEAMERQMIARGKEVGINFSYGGTVRQTTDSHRLIEKAYQTGGEPAQRAVVESLFAGYFENEQDIGSHEFLAQCAVNARVFASTEEALAFLASGEMKESIVKGIMEARQLGVEGVPFVILDNKYAVSGAQGTDTFLQIFRKIAAGAKLAAESEGDTC
ncbi:thioredoxin-like protein [Roridomyces roridus]|uniref:Thioredoxin-like protein n=1 Tax=Roridomyces roridus TaxID=1738132 RepID=A0AAD7BQZ3_9AGAR|nr:thioredoxin-like protein [Roridomyces roridus]